MDPDDQPSTSKKGGSTRGTSGNKQLNSMYPVTFEEFKKFANVEEYVLKEMERAGSEICRINYKIRHKYYPDVYQQFYKSQATRAKMLRNGLTLKAIPKFLKEKLMRMPVDEAEASTSTGKQREKAFEHESKAKHFQETPCTSSANKQVADKTKKKTNHLEKENSSKPNLKPVSAKSKSSVKFTPKNEQIKNKPLAAESRKITSFFASLALANKSPENSQNVRKRKSVTSTENAETEPQIKRHKDSGLTHFESISKSNNNIHKVHRNLSARLRKAKPKRKEAQPQTLGKFSTDLITDDSESESNIQILVDVPVPINSELSHSKENLDDPQTINKKLDERRRQRKGNENKHNTKGTQIKRRWHSALNDLISDDSDVASSIKMVHLSKSPAADNSQSPLKSPLPRRNRIEDFKKLTSSEKSERRKKEERDLNNSFNAEMALLSISGVSYGKRGVRTKSEIEDWLEKGLKSLADESYEEQNTTEYFAEEHVFVDRLKAINIYPVEVRKYIKYLLNLEIQKAKDTNCEAAFRQGSSKSKVVSALMVVSSKAEEKDVTKSMPPLRVFSSELSSTQPSLNRSEADCNVNNKKDLAHDVTVPELVDNVFNKFNEVISVDIVVDSSVKSTHDKHKESPKRNSKCSQQNTMEQKISNDDEIEKNLNEIFYESEEHDTTTNTNNTKHKADHVPIDNDELRRTLSGDFDKQAQAIIKTAGEQQLAEKLDAAGETILLRSLEGSESIVIDNSPDSAGELINKIIQPAHSTQIIYSQNLTDVLSAPSNDMSSKPSEIIGLIPPSPNLFQSSGDSDPKSTQSQQIEKQVPEKVYVPCKHSMTFHTEENNLTPQSFDQTTDNSDPFADSSTNLEDTIVEEINRTVLSTSDPNIVVKQELMSVDGERGCSLELDDSVQFVDVPPPEPIVIEDEETIPDLLEMLISCPTKATNRAPSTVNFTNLSSSGCLENFPQAQRLPSNLTLTQSQSNANTSSNSSIDKDREDAEITKTTDPDIRYESIECIENASEFVVTFLCEQHNHLKTQSQESHFTVKKRTRTRKAKGNEIQTCTYNEVELNKEISSEPRTSQEHLISKSLQSKQLSKDTLLSGSSAEMSYFSIAPQNIPSEIDLTQSSSSQQFKSKEKDCVLKKEPEAISIVEKAETTDEQTSRNLHQESTTSIIREGETSEVISLSSDVESRGIDGGSMEIENVKDESGKDKSLTTESPVNDRSSNIQDGGASVRIIDAEISKDSDVELIDSSYEDEHLESSTNIEDAHASTITIGDEISKENISDVELLENSGSKEALELTTNIQNTDASAMIMCAECSKDGTAGLEVLESNNEKEGIESFTITQGAEASATEISKDSTSDVEFLESSKESFTNTQYVDVYAIVTDSEISKDNSSDVELIENSCEKEALQLFTVTMGADCSKDGTSDVELRETSNENQGLGSSMGAEILKDVFLGAEQVLETRNDKDLESFTNIQNTDASAVTMDVGISRYEIGNGEKEGLGSSKNGEDASASDMATQIGTVFRDILKNAGLFEVEVNEEKEDAGTSNTNRVKLSLAEDISKTIDHADVLRSDSQKIELRRTVSESDLIINVEETSMATQELRTLVNGSESGMLAEYMPENDNSCTNIPLEKSTQVEEEIGPKEVGNASQKCTYYRKGTDESKDIGQTDTTFSTNEVQKAVEDIVQRLHNITAENNQRMDALNKRNPQSPKIISGDLAKNLKLANSSPQSESVLISSEFGDIAILNQTPKVQEAISHTVQQSEFCAEISVTEQATNGFEVSPDITERLLTNTISSIAYNHQPFTFHKPKIYNIPALLPIAAVQNVQNTEVIEIPSITDGLTGESNNEDLIEVPFLIERRFIKSLPFNSLTSEQMQHINGESAIFIIKATINLEEPTNTCPKRVGVHNEKTVISDQEAQLSPTIHRCQFDDRVIRLWLDNEIIPNVTTGIASNIQPSQPGISDENVQQKGHHSPKPLQREKTFPVHPRRKMPPKTKTKNATSKKSSKKRSEPDFVPQKIHAFRSLPLGSSKKRSPSEIDSKESPLTEIIEDPSEVVVSSTASQILGTDCTYFEGSQLLRNIEDQQHPSPKPQVNTFERITMSEGIMARKVWQVNLQCKTKKTFQIEVRFSADKRSLVACDKSAQLLFDFSPAIWSDVLRVLREIDHFEYKWMVSKNCRAVTPLHNVLRCLFDSAAQVVNIRLINDSFNPYATCEKVNSVYRKPLQCLTKTIPPNILRRMKALKENL